MLQFTHDKEQIHADFFGHSDKDLGLYALLENKIAGAIWCRKLKKEDNAQGFINEQTPIMHTVVLKEFQGKGVGTFMMEQFLQEAAALYEQMSVALPHGSKAVEFYEKFGFAPVVHEEKNEPEFVTLFKKIEKKEIIRPSDGYDPSRWMD